MKEIHIRPEEVGAADAKRVLDTLNALNTAEDIDRAIEIPGKPDIGIKLGRRILDRRNEIGEFTSLAQILDVPLIGPERFSSIVVAITGRRPGETEPVQLSALLDELHLLRSKVSALEALNKTACRVTLRIIKSAEFLGQPLVFEARVTDHNLMPKIGVPLTFSTTWGRLQIKDGHTTRQGRAVRVGTGVRGTAQATLLSPLSEQLKQRQQAALESMLGGLKPNTLRPVETEAELLNMARQYRWDIKSNFRRAVDIYFESGEESPKQHVNTHDYMTAWPFIESTIFAHVLGKTEEANANTVVEAAGAIDFRLKNWLGPWLQTYIVLVSAENNLSNEMQAAKQNSKDTNALIESVSKSLVDFVGRERGIVGERIGQNVAKSSVNSFLNDALQEIPLEEAASVLSHLGSISRTISKIGVGVVEVVRESKTGLRKEIGIDVGRLVDTTKLELSSKIDSQNVTVLESLNQSISATKLELSSKIDNQSDRILALETTTRRDLEAVSSELTSLETRMNSKFEAGDDSLSALENRIDNKLDVSAVGSIDVLNQKLSTLDTINSKMTAFEDRINTVEGKLRG